MVRQDPKSSEAENRSIKTKWLLKLTVLSFCAKLVGRCAVECQDELNDMKTPCFATYFTCFHSSLNKWLTRAFCHCPHNWRRTPAHTCPSARTHTHTHTHTGHPHIPPPPQDNNIYTPTPTYPHPPTLGMPRCIPTPSTHPHHSGHTHTHTLSSGIPLEFSFLRQVS